MAVKLARIVFRRIRGKLVPIRKGTEKAAKKGGGISAKTLRKIKLLKRSDKIHFPKKSGPIKIKQSFSATDKMDIFMKKTGAVRVHSQDDILSIDPQTLLTDTQKSVLSRMGKGKEIVTERSSSFNFGQQVREATAGKPKIPSTKTGEKLRKKALKEFGETHTDSITGFVLPRGEKLDFGGGDPFQRGLDHRAVARFINSPPRRPKKGELTSILKQERRRRKLAAKRLHGDN